MDLDGPKVILCQRTITISKVIKTKAYPDGTVTSDVQMMIDGMMDFSLYELGEVLVLVGESISDIKDNLYG